MTRFRPWVIAATLIGLGLGLWVVGRVGFLQVLDVVGRLGLTGFAVLLVMHGVVLWTLGTAWAWSSSPALKPIALFAWARTVREAANELLPFSQLGGLLIGLRITLAAGGAKAPIYAAALIDSLTEIVSQIVFVLAGLAILLFVLIAAPPWGVIAAALAGTLLLAAIVGGAVLFQKPLLSAAGNVAASFLPAVEAQIVEIRTELTARSRHPATLVASTGANLMGWLLAAAASWITLGMLSFDVSFASIVSLEAMISVVRSGAFLIPGALGAQEAGYALLAPSLGIPIDAVLALSLLKRVRDLTIGVPAILIWQTSELRR